MTPTAIHVHPVQDDRCEAAWQPSMPSIMEVSVLRIQFVFIVFCNIPQTTEYLLLYSCCLYSTGITPTPLFSNLSTMALTKTSIIKTRSQSRTGTKAPSVNTGHPDSE